MARCCHYELVGIVNLMQPAIKQMLLKKSSKIVLFSGGGQGPQFRCSAFAASKGAIWRLTETLGHEYAGSGASINAIAPGAVNTKFLEDTLAAGPERVGKEAYAELLKQKESGGTSPELEAALCTWLLSDKSRGLYGKILSAKWDLYKDFTPKQMEELSRSEL